MKLSSQTLRDGCYMPFITSNIMKADFFQRIYSISPAAEKNHGIGNLFLYLSISTEY